MADLFVYGTLTDPEVLRRAAGRIFAAEPAVLDGFRRIEEPGCYPFIEPSPGDRVTGLLLRGIDATALGRLDDYEDEGRLYFRHKVRVEVGSRLIDCETYVGDPGAVRAAGRD